MSDTDRDDRVARGLISGLRNPHPIVDQLPGMFQDDDLTRRFTAALDEVWAPVFATLDNLPAYLSPATTPSDFLDWLAGWVGAELDEAWPEHRQRAFVAHAADLHRWRGTVRGLRELVTVYTGVEPEIVESGGVSWSQAPASDPPGDPRPRVTVHLRVVDPDAVDQAQLRQVVADAIPAHVESFVDVEVVP